MRKTFFICGEGYRDAHTGEEYDDFLFVEDNPSTVTIQEWANKIRDRLRRLWNQMLDDGSERDIDVYFHGASAFSGLLSNLQIIMYQEEHIKFTLAYLDDDKQPLGTYLQRFGRE